MAARRRLDPPVYEVTTSGPAHEKLFEAEVCTGSARGVGRGSTKKDAEQQAAEIAYTTLVCGGRADRWRIMILLGSGQFAEARQ